MEIANSALKSSLLNIGSIMISAILAPLLNILQLTLVVWNVQLCQPSAMHAQEILPVLPALYAARDTTLVAQAVGYVMLRFQIV